MRAAVFAAAAAVAFVAGCESTTELAQPQPQTAASIQRGCANVYQGDAAGLDECVAAGIASDPEVRAERDRARREQQARLDSERQDRAERAREKQLAQKRAKASADSPNRRAVMLQAIGEFGESMKAFGRAINPPTLNCTTMNFGSMSSTTCQ